jgi:hypothetical protein
MTDKRPMKPPSSPATDKQFRRHFVYWSIYRRRMFMGVFVNYVSRQAAMAMRELFGQEPTPGGNPLLELMDLLLGDGFGEVQPPPTVPITSQQWLDWNYLSLMSQHELLAAMDHVLKSEQSELPWDQEAMPTWAASLLLRTLDQLPMM